MNFQNINLTQKFKAFKGLFIHPSQANEGGNDQQSPTSPPEDEVKTPPPDLAEVCRYVHVLGLQDWGEEDGELVLKLELEAEGKDAKFQNPKVLLPARPSNTRQIIYNTTKRVSVFVPKTRWEQVQKDGKPEDLKLIVELWHRSHRGFICIASGETAFTESEEKPQNPLGLVTGDGVRGVQTVTLKKIASSTCISLPASPTGNALATTDPENSDRLAQTQPGGKEERSEADEKKKAKEKEKEDQPVKVTLRFVKQPPKRKMLFFIRHGQSRWNLASSNRDIVGLAKEVDHGLSVEGKHQCLDLQDKIYHGEKEFREGLKAETKDTSCGTEGSAERKREFEKNFFSADEVYSSPLTRAVQTSVIGLAYHPIFKLSPLSPSAEQRAASGKDEISEDSLMVKLLDCAREKRNFGSFDTQANSVGEEIIERAKSELSELYKGQGLPKPVRAMLERIDVNMCTHPWWNTAKESSSAFAVRAREFSTHIGLSTAEKIIVVGHSHFIRSFVKAHMSEDFKKKNAELAQGLSTHTVQNCGVLGLNIDFSNPAKPVIHDLELMFESKLHIKQPVIPDGANLLEGVFSSVQGFVKRQQKKNAQRKSKRHQAREAQWWFDLLTEVKPEAKSENYVFTDVRTETSTWNRQLLNMHLGTMYYSMLMQINPVGLKDWYYSEPSQDTADEEALLTPWDIDALYDDLAAFDLVKKKRPSAVRSRSQSRQRSSSAQKDDESEKKKESPSPKGLSAAKLGITNFFKNIRRDLSPAVQPSPQRGIPLSQVGTLLIPKTLRVLKVEFLGEAKQSASTGLGTVLGTNLEGTYYYAAPGVWRHSDKHRLHIYVQFSSSGRGRRRKSSPKFNVGLGEISGDSLAYSVREFDCLDDLTERALNELKFQPMALQNMKDSVKPKESETKDASNDGDRDVAPLRIALSAVKL
eukprot:CAMPEP_0114494088 /NCGR_PEP_ID=MMETSP0109-20121206/4462_1 /TAXON_ID=29199 /ORGANISM="Chlorarachnion reptans, Strain CCCM449" /LENGTH=924 /DNA_ID=CAMNT_0001671095 /DNA_START=277 /DNA_END=3051 /DNA_ORIENTATION=-